MTAKALEVDQKNGKVVKRKEKCPRRGDGGVWKALEVATVIRPRREWTIRSLKGFKTFPDKIQM